MIAVPNTDTFSLQDVYDSVHSHAIATAGNLQSCFDNAVSYFYDISYNQDGFAPANSMLRFRNYYPYSVTNYLYAIIINNSGDAGKTAISPAYDFTSNSASGNWYYNDQVLLSTNPSYFYSFNLSSSSIASPKRGDVVDMKVRKVIDSSTIKAFAPASGHRMRYFISQTAYTASDLDAILAASTELTASEVLESTDTFWKASFDFNLSLTENNHIYMIWDYGE